MWKVTTPTSPLQGIKNHSPNNVLTSTSNKNIIIIIIIIRIRRRRRRRRRRRVRENVNVPHTTLSLPAEQRNKKILT